MNKPPRPSTAYFDKLTLHEGLERHKQGRVIEFRYNHSGNSIAGKVHGSQPRPYAVSIFLKDSGFEVSWSLCSCNKRKACKHAAALMYSFFDFNDEKGIELATAGTVSRPSGPTAEFKKHTGVVRSTVSPAEKVDPAPTLDDFRDSVVEEKPVIRAGVIDVSRYEDEAHEDSLAGRETTGGVTWRLDVHESKSFWFDITLGIEVEGETIALIPVLKRALSKLKSFGPASIETLGRDGKFFGRLDDGRIIILPFARVRSILHNLVELCNADAEGERVQLSLAQLNALTEGAEAAANFKVFGSPDAVAPIERLRLLVDLQTVTPPEQFNAQLRPYQLDGLTWLQGLARAGLSGILADDMGLGKTVQVLAHLALEKQNSSSADLHKPCLVICPTSVINNWASEAKRFAPQLSTLVYHGAGRGNLPLDSAVDIVITSYALLVRDAKELTDVQWRAVILDESQAIKNAGTKAAKVARALISDYRLCVSGTPVENHLGELWSLFEFLMPGMLGDVKAFTKYFRTPIEKNKRADIRQLLARRLSPFILRRLKEQVAQDLPDKTVIVRELELSSMQRDLYETVRSASEAKVFAEIKSKGLNRSHIIILDALLKLRQVCCDPRLVKLKLPRAVTLADSAKLEALVELLEPLVDAQRKTLVFSQFTSMLDLVAESLTELEIPFVQLRGDTTDRVTPIERFQNGDVPVFLISLKAGGTGLNLTAADTVIHFDPWWNPAVEDQATDRAHRIGQDKKVFVYKLIASGTIEERMLELQTRKRAICEAIFDADSDSISYTEADLQLLFQPL